MPDVRRKASRSRAHMLTHRNSKTHIWLVSQRQVGDRLHGWTTSDLFIILFGVLCFMVSIK